MKAYKLEDGLLLFKRPESVDYEEIEIDIKPEDIELKLYYDLKLYLINGKLISKYEINYKEVEDEIWLLQFLLDHTKDEPEEFSERRMHWRNKITELETLKLGIC